MNHQPWDDGAIADLFAGLVTPQKTTKTYCNRRVVTTQANHKQTVTCPQCIERMVERDRVHEQVIQQLETLKVNITTKAGTRAARRSE